MLFRSFKVKWPCNATGESDQKLPKTKASTGRKMINPRMRTSETERTFMALSLNISDLIYPEPGPVRKPRFGF